MSIHAFGEDAMLKTLFDNGKPTYGVGFIAAMVKPSLNLCFLWVVGLGKESWGQKGVSTTDFVSVAPPLPRLTLITPVGDVA